MAAHEPCCERKAADENLVHRTLSEAQKRLTLLEGEARKIVAENLERVKTLPYVKRLEETLLQSEHLKKIRENARLLLGELHARMPGLRERFKNLPFVGQKPQKTAGAN